MKAVFFAMAISLVGFAAQAETQCPADGDGVGKLILAQASCYEAARVARECAWGSSIDVSFVADAQTFCLKDFEKWPRRHKQIRAMLVSDCNKKYENEEGTLARASNAHCILNVDELLWSLNQAAEL